MPIQAEDERPIVVTARLDAAAFTILDGLRRRHFPPGRNLIPAHLTLFHQLPGAEARNVIESLHEICSRHRPIDLQALPPRSLGRGVALAYEAEKLTVLHGSIARRWDSRLTPQDRQPFRAHVTIQNKVGPSEARALHAALADLPPVPARVEGIDLWRYAGGPWEFMATLPLGG